MKLLYLSIHNLDNTTQYPHNSCPKSDVFVVFLYTWVILSIDELCILTRYHYDMAVKISQNHLSQQVEQRGCGVHYRIQHFCKSVLSIICMQMRLLDISQSCCLEKKSNMLHTYLCLFVFIVPMTALFSQMIMVFIIKHGK